MAMPKIESIGQSGNYVYYKRKIQLVPSVKLNMTRLW